MAVALVVLPIAVSPVMREVECLGTTEAGKIGYVLNIKHDSRYTIGISPNIRHGGDQMTAINCPNSCYTGRIARLHHIYVWTWTLS